MSALKLVLALGALAAGCSAPALDQTTYSCDSDRDCLGGKVCGMKAGVRACVDPGSNPLRFGMSGPLEGPSRGLGIEMRRGIMAYFERVNREGGLFGRRLELECLNDNYDPAMAVENTKRLLDIRQTVADPDLPDLRGPNGVLALIGNIGTPTMLATAPIATKNEVVFFAPFTGAQSYLRDGTNSPYVYNYRAGYYEEANAIVDYLRDFRVPRVITGPDSYKRILAFTQRDSYGDAGYAGLVTAYNTRVAPLPQPDSAAPEPSIARVQYERENVASVDPAVEEAKRLLAAIAAEPRAAGTRLSVAVVMVDTYLPGDRFIRAIKDWLNRDAARAAALDVLFVHVSFVGSDALAAALTSAPATYRDVTDPSGARTKSYAEGVMVTQVVPSYDARSPAVTDYRADIRSLDAGVTSFTSLEGYIVSRLFVEALRRNGSEITSDNLVTTLDTKLAELDIGVGTLLGFSSTNHQASRTVWGSVMDAAGKFKVPFRWNPIDEIIVENN